MDHETQQAEVTDNAPGKDPQQELMRAIRKVMEEVPRISKARQNERMKYHYASIDDFLDTIRPLLIKHGIILVQREDGSEVYTIATKSGNVAMLQIDYVFELYHIGGGHLGPINRSIAVRADGGPVVYGAASAYALKQMLRSMFLIATGDPDADDLNGVDMTQPAGPPRGSGIGGRLLQDIQRLIDETRTDTAAVCRSQGVASLIALSPAKAQRVLQLLQRKKARQMEDSGAAPPMPDRGGRGNIPEPYNTGGQ